jgi:hypothetical protein
MTDLSWTQELRWDIVQAATHINVLAEEVGGLQDAIRGLQQHHTPDDQDRFLEQYRAAIITLRSDLERTL